MGSGPGPSFDSHASVQAVRSWRAGLPVMARERTVSVHDAWSRFSTTHGRVSDSATVSQIEPVHAPWAPRAMAAAIWRPRPMPPAARTATSAGTASTTSGTSTMVEISPQWPPASVPWAMRTSTPRSTLRSAWRGEPHSAPTSTPLEWAASTA